MTPSDVAEVAAALDDERVYRYIGGLLPRSEIERRLLGALRGPPADAPGEIWLNFVVRDAASRAVLGRLEATLHDGIAEVAYLYAPSHWGRGLATAGLHWLHGELRARGVAETWAATLPGNVASAALLERCGYRLVPAEGRPLLHSYDDGDLVFTATNLGRRALERLGPEGGPRLRAIRLRALADAPDAFGSTLADAEGRSPEDWAAQVAQLPTFVWSEGGADLGMVRAAPRDGDPAAAYLISMWVAPEARGRGVGAALVAEVVAWARGRGLRRVLLDVGAHNAAARRLYERLGFAATGATGSLPSPRDHVREVEMALELAGPDGADEGADPAGDGARGRP